jgi:hypothetical protein
VPVDSLKSSITRPNIGTPRSKMEELNRAI